MHHTIVVVDVAGFGERRRTNPDQAAVRAGLYRVLRASLGAVGVSWEDCYHEDRGDAVFVLAPAVVSKSVFVESLPGVLVSELRAHNDSHPDVQRIRLRMAVHAGEVHHDDHGVTSSSLTLAFRLVDAKPVKAALAESPGVLALITSDWFYDDVVRHVPAAEPATYRPVSVVEKETSTTAWVALPDHPYPPAAVVATPSREVPRQLPLAVRDFTGRADHLSALDALAESDRTTVVITAIDGAGGIGKTSLAVYWAHRNQHAFPDGTLHVNLRGYGPGTPASPGEVLDGFLRALNVPAERVPLEEDAKAGLYRSLVDGRRMLIVLDNANSADQVRPLLPGSPGCMVLVTSRDSLTGLVVTETAHRLTLDLLTPAEAQSLVTGIIGPDRAGAEPDAVTTLVRLCARLPLALRIAATRIATHPTTTVADVVAELSDDGDRLAVLSRSSDERSAIRTVFDWSYQRLPADHARVFRLLGLHPGPSPSVHAAAALTGVAPPAVHDLLNHLAETHHIEPVTSTRYRMHDLLRAYAADLAHHHDTPEDRDQALQRLLDWYVDTARSCDEQLYPNLDHLDLPGATPTFPVHVHGRDEALSWFMDEQENLFAALRAAMRHKFYHHSIQLVERIRFVNFTTGWARGIEANREGLTAARSIGSDTAVSYFHAILGDYLALFGQLDAARVEYDQALVLARAHTDNSRIGQALNGLAIVCNNRQQFDAALAHLLEASRLLAGKGVGRLEAVVDANLSISYSGLGRYRDAIEHGERSLKVSRCGGDIHGEAYALRLLALARQGQGEHRQAAELSREAVELGRSIDFIPLDLADILETHGISLLHEGQVTEAIACWHEAGELFDQLGISHRSAEIRQRIETALGPTAGDQIAYGEG